MNKPTAGREGIYASGFVRRIASWLDALPHPLLACEITPEYVAAARWTRGGATLDAFAVESLPRGAIVPSAVDVNLADSAAVRSAVGRVFARLHAKSQPIALLVPDPVVRIFILHFDRFPRAASEAIPMLRWKLKKSVPFETDETLVSYMRQTAREQGVDIVTGLARQRIVREYEQLAEANGMVPGVVMSSTLATLPLLDDRRPSLLARISGSALATAIVREGVLCGYRCTDLPSDPRNLTPQVLLDEIYPLAAYYQASWHESIQLVRLAGLANRVPEFRGPLEAELRCPVGPLLTAAAKEGRIPNDVQPLIDRHLDALLGWMLN